ncbi:MAG: DNA-processing protein DprA [Clostridiales bacterium]|nr:DNA-processing protein DprA [Clostridiales bacterium]
MILDNAESRFEDMFYSAVMLNTEVTYKTLCDLKDNMAIKDYRDLHDRELLKAIAKGEFKLRNDTVLRIKKLLETFGNLENIVEKYIQIAQANNIGVVSVLDKFYPYNWRALSGMPQVFYCRGDYSLIDSMTLKGSVAVVGSRSPSKYAQYATDQICKELGEKAVTIVSGMAYGIDRQAHLSSVNTKGGTIAILAGGVDNIYPPKNKDIYDLISRNGLIISEMPPGQQPLRQYFPSRNRLIAGLTDCTVVMEAGTVSGTLHTASFAANQGKEVFVLPNNIYYENAKGGLKLLEDGGNVLLGAENVIDSVARSVMYKRLALGCPAELNYYDDKEDFEGQNDIDAIRVLAKVKPEVISDDQWKLLIQDALSLKSLCVDELCVITMLPFYKVSKLLTELELNGTVCQEKGKYSLTFV